MALHGLVCHICCEAIDASLPRGYREPASLVMDHVVPLSRGGADALSNIRPAHWACNARKGSRVVSAGAEGAAEF